MQPKRLRTRLLLMRAGERIFADQGPDASLRDVVLQAGQKNVNAISYHFETREGFLDSMVERHTVPLGRRLTRRLTETSVSRRSLGTVVGTMVSVLAEKLDDPDGGPEFLKIMAWLATSAKSPLARLRCMQSSTVFELERMLFGYINLEHRSLAQLRLRRFANILFTSFVDSMRLHELGIFVPRTLLLEEVTTAGVLALTCGTAPHAEEGGAHARSQQATLRGLPSGRPRLIRTAKHAT